MLEELHISHGIIFRMSLHEKKIIWFISYFTATAIVVAAVAGDRC